MINKDDLFILFYFILFYNFSKIFLNISILRFLSLSFVNKNDKISDFCCDVGKRITLKIKAFNRFCVIYVASVHFVNKVK